MALNGRIETGMMNVNKSGNVTITPDTKYDIGIGYHDGTTRIQAQTLTEVTSKGNVESTDMVYGYNGWAKGKNIIGILADKESSSDFLSIDADSTKVRVYFQRGAYLKTSNNSIYPSLRVPEDVLATLINVKPETIAKGTSYLGIKGIVSEGATATEDDILWGYTGYSDGDLIVGKLTPSLPYSTTAAFSGNDILTINWYNPTQGPYQGVKIYMRTATSDEATSGNGGDDSKLVSIYTGTGSSTSPNEKSSINITGINNKIGSSEYYQLRLVGYSGAVNSRNEFIAYIHNQYYKK